MALPALLALAPLIMGGIQTLTGAIQGATNKRPSPLNYQIPAEVYGYLNTMGRRAQTGLPGKDLMQENMMSQIAGMGTQLRAGSSSGAALMGSTNQLLGQSYDGLRAIELMDSQFKDNAKVDYARALMQMAEYKDRKWDINENQPHIQAMTEYFNKKNASNQNLFGGLNSISRYGFAVGMSPTLQETIGSIFNKDAPVTTAGGQTNNEINSEAWSMLNNMFGVKYGYGAMGQEFNYDYED